MSRVTQHGNRWWKALMALLASISAIPIAAASSVSLQRSITFAGSQSTAVAYMDAVETALLDPIATNASLEVYNYVGFTLPLGWGLGGLDQVGPYPPWNIATKVKVDFSLGVDVTEPVRLRFAVDFGYGGAVFINGSPAAFERNDMWWGDQGSFSTGVFLIDLPALPGDYSVSIYGIEYCCDARHVGQFSINGGDFVYFGNNDGLKTPSPIPEPSTYALMALGLGAIAYRARRRRKATGHSRSN